ncbi:hypothetical protein NBRC3257_1913 [Gluconobacter thailandicus NBRC 3257]|uniref:Transposase n=1 Tax=Gluconobacter thailandicus NBRC 3257 TaxID=1381097 RepID=A0ABQ0IXH7_GLUTH|nr:hypothetical protein NBRC3257_1913 [Gluconobacter thailandicus NBRC 3257]
MATVGLSAQGVENDPVRMLRKLFSLMVDCPFPKMSLT